MAHATKQEKMQRKDPLVRACAAELGANVRTLRKAQNLSQATLAIMMNTEHPRISDIERGLVNARIQDIVELARALDVEPVELLDLEKFTLADHPAPLPYEHARL